jgi:hypothetical protein
LADRVVGDHDVGPHGTQQLILREDPLRVAREVAQHRERLRPQREQCATAYQFGAVEVERERAELQPCGMTPRNDGGIQR